MRTRAREFQLKFVEYLRKYYLTWVKKKLDKKKWVTDNRSLILHLNFWVTILFGFCFVFLNSLILVQHKRSDSWYHSELANHEWTLLYYNEFMFKIHRKLCCWISLQFEVISEFHAIKLLSVINCSFCDFHSIDSTNSLYHFSHHNFKRVDFCIL